MPKHERNSRRRRSRPPGPVICSFPFVPSIILTKIATHDLYTHTWSLGVRKQFYLVWPVLLLAIFRMTGFLSADGERGRRRLPFRLGHRHAGQLGLIPILDVSPATIGVLPDAFPSLAARSWRHRALRSEARKRDSRPEDRILRWSQGRAERRTRSDPWLRSMPEPEHGLSRILGAAPPPWVPP